VEVFKKLDFSVETLRNGINNRIKNKNDVLGCTRHHFYRAMGFPGESRSNHENRTEFAPRRDRDEIEELIFIFPEIA